MPHTFRRRYITFMLAAGFDVPYVRAQVGHRDPAVTLGMYAHVIERPDRDRLEAEMRDLIGAAAPEGSVAPRPAIALEKAPKGPKAA
jgi:hypothetical protein